jgi:polyisoprenoid-binding protein YceI
MPVLTAILRISRMDFAFADRLCTPAITRTGPLVLSIGARTFKPVVYWFAPAARLAAARIFDAHHEDDSMPCPIGRAAISGCIIGALACLALPARAAPETLALDPGHTFPTFEVRHLGLATQRGRFNHTTGTVVLDLAAGTGSVDISIDANSADTGNPDLDRLLRGKFYLNPEQYPAITYKSTAMLFENQKPVLVKGELSFLGQTRPLDLKVVGFGCSRLPFLGSRCGADLTASFRRSDFGMTAMLGFVSDEVNMLIQAEAVPPAAPAREPGQP